MKTRKLRLLSVLLALAMMLALLPTAAFAETVYGTISGAPGGNCGAEGDGSNVTWELDSNGTLTIDGKGKMKDYTWGTAPWYSQRDSIKQVVIENGVTNVGNCAFYNCTNMTSVSVSASVTDIGEWAFANSGITNITIPASVTTIGMDAFFGCSELRSVDLSNATALKEIKAYAFARCSTLKEVKLPQNGILETIGVCAFGSDMNDYPELAPKITEIKIPASVKVIGMQAFVHCDELSKVFFAEKSQLTTMGAGAFENNRVNMLFYTNDENVKQLLLQTMGYQIEEADILPLPQPELKPEAYPITIDYGTAYDADHNAIAKAAAGETVYLEANETAFDGMVFEYWKDHNGNVTLANDHAAKTSFEMPEGEVHLEAMYKTDSDDSSWDAATVVTGVAIGTGTAILAYHIGTELYAEQVLGKGTAVPRTRAEVALLAWQLAGSPAVNVEGEPLSEAAQAEKWAVESGLMEPDAEGNFNGAKKMSKLKALRTLEKAKQ